jgi:outer membrane receptor protein involved in Fe transport
MKTFTKIFLMIFCISTYAQTSVTGTVKDDSGLPLPSANVIVDGTSVGTVTDFDGNFSLTVDQDPPFTLLVSSIGFESASQEVTSNNQTLDFVLAEGTTLDEVVVSASRTPERIFESPVTVERFGLKEIKNTASSDFYDGLENLKGVDINTNSLTFKSINTRGFATFSNTRFMQLVDGMDNSAPALNFPLGNLLGMIETDIQSVELLPGAASALYGANAFNGILFMTSKSPFDHQGLSGYYKQGLTSQEAAGDNTYTDFGMRAAYKFSDKFAVKANFGYLKGTDWAANNTDGKPGTGSSRADLGYDGYNVYGDEVNVDINVVAQGMIDAGILPPQVLPIVPSVIVSRTGYDEGDLTDYKAESVKADWGLYYRPWGDDFEIQYVGKYGTGNTIYQGTNRYNIDHFNMQQHKLEIKNDNFFLRGYMTVDQAGDSYDMVFTGININQAWKPHETWFGEYVGAYVNAFSGLVPGIPAGNVDAAHGFGRYFADQGRLVPGTAEFNSALQAITSDPDLSTGSKFQDNSKIYHADANYNFSHLTDVAEIQVGGSFRQYELNSSGTIYTDADGPINYSEFGIYAQVQKKFLEDERLKFTGSIRYDKAIDLFDGFVSPRIALGYTAGAEKNHNIRASFQTGFRNPTTQDLFIGLDAGSATLVGSARENIGTDVGEEDSGYGIGRYSKAYALAQGGNDPLLNFYGIGGSNGTVTQNGSAAYINSFSAISAITFGAILEQGGLAALPQAMAVLEAGNPDPVKPEKVTSYEVGYRGKFERTIVDLSAYYNKYEDFLANEVVIAPLYGSIDLSDTFAVPQLGDIPRAAYALINGDRIIYQTYTNSEVPVKSYGGSIGISTKVFGNYDLSGNYTYTKEDFDTKKYPDFRTNFNTPEHKFKASFGNTNLFENFGFNVAWRWSDTYFWQAAFGDGDIPARHTLDAQLNLRVPSLKSTFKVGATNILSDEYFSAIGTGFIGSMYYVSLVINNL